MSRTDCLDDVRVLVRYVRYGSHIFQLQDRRKDLYQVLMREGATSPMLDRRDDAVKASVSS